MPKKKLTCTACLITNHGTIPLKNLSEKEQESLHNKWRERISTELSCFYSANPERYGAI